MQRKEEGRRISAKGRNPRLGLAGRISPATRHLVAGHRDPWLGIADHGFGFFFFPSGFGESDFFCFVFVFRMIKFQIGFTFPSRF
jgi:hypothetical protein